MILSFGGEEIILSSVPLGLSVFISLLPPAHRAPFCPVGILKSCGYFTLLGVLHFCSIFRNFHSILSLLTARGPPSLPSSLFALLTRYS